MPANLELVIEELILPGLPAGYQEFVTIALEEELTRLWREHGALTVTADKPIRLDGATLEILPQSAPEAIGIQVAQSIFQNLRAAGGTNGDGLAPQAGGAR